MILVKTTRIIMMSTLMIFSWCLVMVLKLPKIDLMKVPPTVAGRSRASSLGRAKVRQHVIQGSACSGVQHVATCRGRRGPQRGLHFCPSAARSSMHLLGSIASEKLSKISHLNYSDAVQGLENRRTFGAWNSSFFIFFSIYSSFPETS